MITIESYPLAVFLCFVVMLAWGSWPNTLKLCPPQWRFQLFYWDYAVGVLLFSLLMALSLGSVGEHGPRLNDHDALTTPFDGTFPPVDRDHSRQNVNAGRKPRIDECPPSRLRRFRIGIGGIDQNGLVVRVQVSEPSRA